MDGQRLIDGPMGGSTATPKRTGRTDKYGQLAERKDGFRRYERNRMRMNGLVGQSLDAVEDCAIGKNVVLFIKIHNISSLRIN